MTHATSPPLAADASAADVQAGVSSLEGVGAVEVSREETVSPAGFKWTVVFLELVI